MALGMVLVGGLLAGCPGPDQPPPFQGDNPLLFVYPANGQKDIVTSVEPVVIFPSSVDADALQQSLVLADAQGQPVPVEVTVLSLRPPKPDSPPRAVVKVCTGTVDSATGQCTPTPLRPDTIYSLKTTATLHSGNDTFKAGTVLTQFQTRTLAGAHATAANGQPVGLVAVAHSPGGDAGDGVGNNFAFGSFSYQPRSTPDPTTDPGTPVGAPVNLANTLHITFSEVLDAASVVQGKSFTFTNSAGTAVPGLLYVQGNEVSFQPQPANGQQLPAGSYNVAFTSDVRALNGDALRPDAQSVFTLKVKDAGPPSREFLKIVAGASDKSALNGDVVNSISVASSLIGSNAVAAQDDAQRGELVAYLGELPGFPDPRHPGNDSYAVLPVAIPAGTQLVSSSLNVTLDKQANGDGINAQLKTGPLTITMLDTANAYFFQNPHRRDGQPTALIMHLDMSLAGSDPSGNAVLNQTVLNVTAVGTVRAYKGQLFANAVAQIPLTVANTNIAIATLNLQLVLPSKMSTELARQCHLNPVLADGQCPAKPDTTPPTFLAFAPSACFYAFGSSNDSSATNNGTGSAPPSGIGPDGTPVDCSAGGVTPDSYPRDASPAVLFDEAIDSTTLATHDANHIQLSQAGTPVAFTTKVEGTSVVVHPDAPLAADTAYTLTVGTGLTDLGGNALGASASQTFTTRPYDTGTPAPVYITTVNPGLPCALDPASGDFTTGGNTAGYCLGDMPSGGDAHQVFNVFPIQANLPVAAYFTKPVKASSIVPADGCLTPGTGTAATKGSFAVELVNASGRCTGVVPGAVTLAHVGAAATRRFQYIPDQPFVQGQRYWLVICGTKNSACSTSQRVTDVDGLALNTTPIVNSGSGSTAVGTTPDLIEPFIAIKPTQNYRIVLQAQPNSDTNGNGKLDTGERPETANVSALHLGVLGLQLPNALKAYMSGERPIEIQSLQQPCSNLPAAAIAAIGSTPPECLPFFLSAGGMFWLTGIDVNISTVLSAVDVQTLQGLASNPSLPAPLASALGGLANTLINNNLTQAFQDLALAPVKNALAGVLGTLGLDSASLASTGRVVLRLRGCDATQAAGCTPLDGAQAVGAVTAGGTLAHQTGYIVNECTGSIGSKAYDFKPCIVAPLNLNVNVPDGNNLSLPQSTLAATVVGPLSFTDNGRLVTQLVNFNTLQLNAQLLGLLPATATIKPGELHLQLAGYPVHGN